MGGEGGHRLARRHRCRRAPGQAGEHDALGHAGLGQFPPDRRRRRSQRADAGHDLEAPFLGYAPVDLLADGAVDRRVPRVEPHDRRFVWGAGVDRKHVLEGHGGRVVDRHPRPGMDEDGLRDQRRGPHHHVGRGQPVPPPQGDQVRRPRPGPDEADHRARPAGGTITVAR